MHISIGSFIRFARAYVGISQAQLAKLSGVSIKTISAVERSDRLRPEIRAALEAGGAVIEHRQVRWEMLVILLTPHGLIAEMGTLTVVESKIVSLLNPLTSDLVEAAAALRSALEAQGVIFLADGNISIDADTAAKIAPQCGGSRPG